MRLTKSLGFAGALILSAIVGGTLIGSALATDADGTTTARRPSTATSSWTASPPSSGPIATG